MSILFSASTFAQKVNVLSLDSILLKIENNNMQLKSFETKAKSYQYAAEAVSGWMPPMIGVGNYMSPYPGQMLMNPTDKGSLMLQIEQDIPSFKKQKAKKDYVNAQANIVENEAGILLNTYKAKAKELYYSWLIALQKNKILDRAQNLLSVMKKIEHIRLPFNQTKLGNIYQTDIKIAENKNQKTELEGDILKYKSWLNSLMFRAGNTDFEIDTNIVPVFKQYEIDTNSLAVQRQDVKKMNAEIIAMNLNIKAVNLERRPEFKIRYDHMSPLSGNMPKAFSLMGMISIPIVPWSAKMYKNETKAMQLEVESMQMQKQAMLMETSGMLYGMKAKIQKMQKQIDMMEKNIIPSLEKSFELSLLNYRENKAQLTEVIMALDAVNMMQNNVLDDRLKLYLMIVDYEKELYR